MSNNTPTTAHLILLRPEPAVLSSPLRAHTYFLTRRKPADIVTTGLAASTNRRLKRNGGQNY